MGAGVSNTNQDKNLNINPEEPFEGQIKSRNYVPICSPPKYDLTFDSTDSEITELVENPHPNINKKSTDILPILNRLNSIAEPIVEEEENEGLSSVSEEPSEEKPTAEQSLYTESTEEETHIENPEEVLESIEEQEPEINTEVLSTGVTDESKYTPEIPQVVKRRDTFQTEPTIFDDEVTSIVPITSSVCSIGPICTRPDICKVKRCPRKVTFVNDHSPIPKKETSYVSRHYYPHEFETDRKKDEYDCYCTDEDSSYETSKYSDKLGIVLEDEEEEVMPDYQRYSREQPEKDANNGKKAADSTNMRDCCRSCYPSRTASLKHNQAQLSHNTNICRCSASQRNQGNRRISESYVSCRNQSKHPSYCKSVPNQIEERDSYSNFHVTDNQHTKKNLPRHQHPPRKVLSRTYPPAHCFDRHTDQDRPHIPLPPPPDQFSSEQASITPNQAQVPTLSQNQNRTRTEQNSDSANRPTGEEQEDHKAMYSHNTNRNFATKKSFNRLYNHKVMKSYPYVEPSGSTTYSHDSACSNNCSGYEHCPMHHTCRCQCLCLNSDENNYCSQGQSDDQLSYCSDSSNSESLNLAYQRTGDYPELMDELENTLSHRNRIRVQKTMQRFEMLSRQNKNLDKPIFEDEESLRQYNNGMRMHHDKHSGHECRCQHCEDKLRRQNFKRNEAMGKRPNYQSIPCPRNAGYVEKVARYMDPNLNNIRENNPRKKLDDRRDLPTTMINNNGTWQMDTRKNEWVKVDPAHPRGGATQYDFENTYPPLPPRPISEHMYDRRSYCQDRGPCSCPKCLRRR